MLNKNINPNNDVIWHNNLISREERYALNGHKSGLVWFTGLPASGKSTIAHSVERVLFYRGIRTYVLDGDNIRHGLNVDLDFSTKDRKENIRRIAEVSKLMVDAGLMVLAAFISPFEQDRDYIRNFFSGEIFLEVYVKCSLEECERRDPKGQYKKARSGLLKGYTGISGVFDVPSKPDLIIDTEKTSVDQATLQVLEHIEKLKIY
jgi:adenylylsulfate kinase